MASKPEKAKEDEPGAEIRHARIAKVISLVVVVAGITVMAGWLLEIPALKSISPSWPNMKFSTAIAFVMSGISIYFIARALEGEFETAQIVLFMTSLVIAILMGLLLFSELSGIQTGTEDLFVRDTGGAKSVVPGRPSFPTMINFLLITFAAVLTIVNPRGLRQMLKKIGAVIGAVGVLAGAGYVFNAPLLYYYIAGVNPAMAMPTALLFALIGAGILCL